MWDIFYSLHASYVQRDRVQLYWSLGPELYEIIEQNMHEAPNPFAAELIWVDVTDAEFNQREAKSDFVKYEGEAILHLNIKERPATHEEHRPQHLKVTLIRPLDEIYSHYEWKVHTLIDH